MPSNPLGPLEAARKAASERAEARQKEESQKIYALLILETTKA